MNGRVGYDSLVASSILTRGLTPPDVEADGSSDRSYAHSFDEPRHLCIYAFDFMELYHIHFHVLQISSLISTYLDGTCLVSW